MTTTTRTANGDKSERQTTNTIWNGFYQIREDKQNIFISTGAPGVKWKDLAIQLEKGKQILSISGERRIKTTRGRRIKQFDRRMFLADRVDSHSMKARLAKGKLYIIAPKLR